MDLKGHLESRRFGGGYGSDYFNSALGKTLDGVEQFAYVQYK